MKENRLNFLFWISIFLLNCFNHTLLADQNKSWNKITADHGLVENAFLIEKSVNDYRIGNVRWGIKSPDYRKITVEEREYHWKSASINPSMVDEVYFIVKPFFPKVIAGHGYALFTFFPGGFVGSDGSKPEGLVISYEIFKEPGMRLKDIDFVKKGTHDFYKIGAVVATWEDYVTVECEMNRRDLNVFRLNFNAQQKQAFLKIAIEDATKDRSNEFYHTVKNSCVTNQVRMINQVIPEEKRIKTMIGNGKIINPAGFIPRKIARTYEKNGIMTELEPEITPANYFVKVKQLFKTAK